MLSFYSNERITCTYTTAMAPWRGGFYERLVGLVKQGLRKEIGRVKTRLFECIKREFTTSHKES